MSPDCLIITILSYKIVSDCHISCRLTDIPLIRTALLSLDKLAINRHPKVVEQQIHSFCNTVYQPRILFSDKGKTSSEFHEKLWHFLREPLSARLRHTVCRWSENWNYRDSSSSPHKINLPGLEGNIQIREIAFPQPVIKIRIKEIIQTV